MVSRLRRASRKEAASLRADCIQFAGAIVARWPEDKYGGRYDRDEKSDDLMQTIATLDEPELVRSYLTHVLTRDTSIQPGKALVTACQKHGWGTFRPELEAVVRATATHSIRRNVRLLEQFCLAKPRKKEDWAELCQTLAVPLVDALESLDQAAKSDWQAREVNRAKVLTDLARALLASEQPDLLSRLVDHALARPEQYPFPELHIKALTTLGPWIEKNVKKPSVALSRWVAACRERLEVLTAQVPQPPADFRRPSTLSCRCSHCAELKRFLEDPTEPEHRFRAIQGVRTHLEEIIKRDHCDLNLRTEKERSPYTLVCTKNDASYRRQLKKYHEDQKHLETMRSIEASLPQ
jgi:hypothetical protein